MNKQFFADEAQYKTFASGLRRELQGLGVAMSHNQFLELTARSLGHASFASLKAQQPLKPAVTPADPAPKATYLGELTDIADRARYAAYRLYNHSGDLDFHKTGTTPLSGRSWSAIDGSVEDIPGSLGYILHIRRDESGGIQVEQNGTAVDWDCQRTRTDLRGRRIFYAANGFICPEDHLVFFDEDLFPDVQSLTKLDVVVEHQLASREVLVTACRRFVVDSGLTATFLTEVPEGAEGQSEASRAARDWYPSDKFSSLGAAQWAVGFAMHAGELNELRNSLR